MMFIAVAFVGIILIGAPVCGLLYLALSLLFRHLHRRYMAQADDGAPRKWRRMLSVVCAVLSAVCLAAGAAGWIFYLAANA